MSHRRSGWVGAVVLVLVAVSAACGGRDNVFVLDDAAPSGSGGTVGHAGTLGTGNIGNTTSGGHGGTIGVGGHGGFIGGAGFSGSVGVGGHAGSVGLGGTAGFGGIGVGGTTGFDCAACLATNTGHNPCGMAVCNFVRGTCDVMPDNEGQICFGAGTCAPRICKGGECTQAPTTSCPASTTQCEVAACDMKSGQCVSQPSTGTACDDSDPCTVKDQCLMGKCTPGQRITICQNNDKCCPAGCTTNLDNDCTGPTQITLPTTDRGWYQNAGSHEPQNKNTLTGFSSGAIYNSYFSFDLTPVRGTITAAQLSLEQETYYGTDATETASIWDVTTNASTLSDTLQSLAIFNDLQSGIQYGSLTTATKLTGTVITTTLNASAVTALNAARGGQFSVGLHLDTLSGQMLTDEGVRFSASDEPRKNQLILTVQ